MKSSSLKWFCLFLLASIWGASFLLMKKGMYSADGKMVFSDVQVAGLRILLASLSLLPFAIRRVRKSISFRDWLFLLGVGCFGNFFPAFLFTYAETQVSSGYAGMLNSATPIFALLIGVVIFKNRLSSWQLVGSFVGLVGVVCLMLSGGDLSSSGSLMHILAIVLATFFYGISVNIIREKLPHLKSVDIASVSFLLLFIPSLFIVYFSGAVDVVVNSPGSINNLLYIAVLSFVGTSFALILFNYIIKLSDVFFATSVTYLIPIFAVSFGLMYGEHFSFLQFISMLIVLAGIFMANIKRKSKP